MFFLFGVKGVFLFLITKKEKYPLKPRCSLNNKNALCKLCLRKELCTHFRNFPIGKSYRSYIGYRFRLSNESLTFGVLFQNTSFVRFTYSPCLQAEASVSRNGEVIGGEKLRPRKELVFPS